MLSPCFRTKIYSEMVYDGNHVSLMTYPELMGQLILLDGWSKTFAMTGWRLGYGVWLTALFPCAERLAINCHSCVNAAAQHAGIAALTGSREPVRHMVATFAERRDYIVPALNTLPGIRCVIPGGAFYAFPNTRDTGFGSRTLHSRLLDEAGVSTISGTSFGALGEGHLRFSYAASLHALTEAISRGWISSVSETRTISGFSIFLPRNSGVRPTIRPATNTAMMS